MTVERQLRDSLRRRADDVEPTAALWNRVESRTRQRQRRTRIGIGIGAALAVIVAVLAVPSIMGQPDPEDVVVVPEPTTTPTTPTSPPATAAPPGQMAARLPTHLVVVEPQRLRLVTVAGNDLATLVDTTGPEAEGANLAVSIRPGSTADDLVAVYLRESEGAVDAWYVALVDGQPARPQRISGPLGPQVSATSPSVAWSADGARVRYPTADGIATLRWGDDGPVGEASVEPRSAPLTLWSGLGDGVLASTPEAGLVTVTGSQVNPLQAAPESLGDVAAAAATTSEPNIVYVAASDAAEGEGVRALWFTTDGSQRGDLPLPPEVVVSPRVWVTAWQDGVLVGDGEQVWLLDRTEQTVADLTAGSYAAPVPAVAPLSDSPSPVPIGDEVYLAAPEGGDLAVVDAGGEPMRRLLDADTTAQLTGMAVRPGSTASDLTLVAVRTTGPAQSLVWMTVTDGAPSPLRDFPAEYQPQAGDGAPVAAVWSSDGATIAWVEEAADGFRLRTVGWDDGPGTGNTATDNASFAVPFPSTVTAAVLDAFVVEPRPGLLSFRVVTGVGPDVLHLEVERQADGAIAVATSEPVRFPPDEVAWLDQAAHPEGRFHLVVGGEPGLVLGLTTSEGVRPLRFPADFDVAAALERPLEAGPFLEPSPSGALLLDPGGTVWKLSPSGDLQVLFSGMEDVRALD